MSAPTSHDPLVVNTADGVVWLRRAVTADGRGLYAVTGSCSCPEYLMATLAELAEHGIAGSADVLPMPVGPEPQARRERYAKAVLQVKSLAGVFADVRPHVDPVMALADEELAGLRARIAELEAERHSTNEALDDAVTELRARRDDVTPQVRKLRALLAGQRERAGGE